MTMAKRRVFTFCEECDFGTTPQRVYHILVYPDTLPELDHDVRYWQPDELPPRVGTLCHMKVKVFGVPTFIGLTSRFAEVDPPFRFVIEGVRPSFTSGTRWTVELEEITGGTRGKSTIEISSPRWAAPFGRVARYFLRRSVRKGIRGLHARLGPPR